VTVDTTHAFYRAKTALARDLAVLAARHVSTPDNPVTVLDVLTGSGIRAARYLAHANAKRVVANDISTHTRLEANLAAVAADGTWETTHEDGCRLLARLALDGETFTVLDVDGFGSSGVPVSLALGCVRFGGLLVLNCTDWAGLSGRESSSTIAAYGSVVHSCPSAPENALRVLLGSAARDAAQRGMHIHPVLSYAAPGPAYRVIVRVIRGGSASMTQLLGFNCFCRRCSAVWHTPWPDLGSAGACRHCGSTLDVRVNGPLWAGPLHDADMLRSMEADAASLGWLSDEPGQQSSSSLSSLLALLREEAVASGLVPFFIRLDQVGRAANLPQQPSREALGRALTARGFTVTRTQCHSAALRTDAPWADVLQAAKDTAQRTRT
jgi:tRNA (guanine26-N2/guanine27-N2)-dimethyltransferase